MKLTVLKNNVPINDVLVEIPDLDERYEIFIGRSDDCHVKIDDPLISRHHVVVKNENTQWYVEKLTNLGVVSLNGSLVTKLPIQNNDEIKCGIYSIIVSSISSLPSHTTTSYFKEPAPSSAPVFDYDPVHTLEAQDATVALPKASSPKKIVAEEPSVETEDEFNSEDSASEEIQNDEFNSEDTNSERLNESSSEYGTEESGFEGGALEEVQDDFDNSPVADESTRVFKAFVNYQLTLFGEHAPYDRYQLDQQEVFIGRESKKCQIVLDDPEVSTIHAVIKKNNIEITLEDLNSSNGTILNGERINKAVLVAGDEFVIGSTSFTLEVRSDLLDAESDRLMPVEAGQTIETEEYLEEEMTEEESTAFDSNAPVEKSAVKRFWNKLNPRQKIIYGIIGIAALIWFLDSGEPELPPTAKPKAEAKTVDANAQKVLALSKEQTERRNTSYELGVDYFEQGKYNEALAQFEIVKSIDPSYKKTLSYLEQTTASLKKISELEAEKRAEEERLKTKKIIEELLVKAREAVKERQVGVAESYFAQITEKDPENIEVQQLKMEIENWQQEESRKKLEIAAKEASRKAMVDALNPGKTFYLKKEWYRAILKLEEFLRRKGTDEDLVKEGSDMLSDAKTQLASDLGPLLGKARSLKEGQDLKAAYEAYLEVLKVEPTNAESLNEVDDIKAQLEGKSKRIYREAIIAESLSLFNDAKEKFQEVQQVSPTDSEYYKKASDKLKDYLE